MCHNLCQITEHADEHGLAGRSHEQIAKGFEVCLPCFKQCEAATVVSHVELR
jgi:hypothetical protein